MTSPFGPPRDLFASVLREHTHNLPYHQAVRLADLAGGRHVLVTNDWTFDLERYAIAGHAELTATLEVAPLDELDFRGLERGTRVRREVGWFSIVWQSHRLHVLRTTHREGGCGQENHFVVADDPDVARRFHEAVCRFASDVPRVVWVYARGCWSRSSDLYEAIHAASFDDLVLAPHLERTLVRDFRSFLAAKDLYARYRTPHRRGALFVGPPGNGKTHAIRALLKEIALPILYVKSLKVRSSTENDSIAEVFDEARDRAPCVLVLEDLDALVTDETRSVFLNELDGFARNDGVVTIATTNHPERLDPALLERPSRFDRKYLFDVPSAEERRRYLARWRARVDDEARPTEEVIARIAERTQGFSFAYLQELTLASMMRWVEIAADGHGRQPMDGVLTEQLDALAREMSLR